MASAKHNLCSIPPELTELIAQLADPPDLFALRLVSHEVKARTHEPFAKAFFTKRVFLLSSEESLELLLRIAEHKPFARHLKKIAFCIDELPKPRKKISSRDGTMQYDNNRYPQLKALYRRQMELRTTGRDLSLLTATFNHLRRYGTMDEISVIDFRTTWSTGSSVRHHPYLIRRDFIRPTRGGASEHYLVMEALLRSATAVRSFSIRNSVCDTCLLEYWQDDRVVDALRNVLRSVKSLDWGYMVIDSGEPAVQQCFDEFISLLASVVELEDLTLHAGGPRMFGIEREGTAVGELDQSDAYIGKALLAAQLSGALRTMSLWDYALSFDALVAFVARHPALVSLRLEYVLFMDMPPYDTQADFQQLMVELLEEKTGLKHVTVEQCADWQDGHVSADFWDDW